MSLDQLTALKLHLHAGHPKEEGETVDLDSSSQTEAHMYGVMHEEVSAEDMAAQMQAVQAFLSEILSRHWPFVVDLYSKEARELYNPYLEFAHDAFPHHLNLKAEWRTVQWGINSLNTAGCVAVYENEDDMFAVLDELKRRAQSIRSAA